MNYCQKIHYNIFQTSQTDFNSAVDELLACIPQNEVVLRLVFFGMPLSNSQYLERRLLIREKIRHRYQQMEPALTYVAQPPLGATLIMEVHSYVPEADDSIVFRHYEGTPYVLLENKEMKCLYAGGFQEDILMFGIRQQASGVFCTLLDDASLSVRFPVLEAEYAYIKQGMKVKIRPFAFQGKEMEGKITHVNPSVDENGQIMVDAVLENDGSLIDGMNVRVVVCQQVPDCFVVPKEAVLLRDGREVLFLYQEGKAVWTYVDILLSNSHEYVVEANRERGGGLEEGDQVIVSGNLNLVDGSDVVLSGGGTGAEHAKAL